MKWFNILRDRLRALRRRDSVINDIDRAMRIDPMMALRYE